MPESLLKKFVLKPFKNYVTTPLREHVTNPLRGLLGLETDSVRDTHIDEALQAIQKKLQVETLPGSNIISVVLSTSDPAQGTVFVERLLHNYLQSRQNLQSNNLPEEFYEQKKQHYRNRIDALEHTRQQILEGANASHPAEEITFRLNAVNTEEQSLNQYRDRLLESRAWLDYLNKSLVEARKIGQKEYAFPFTFKQLIGDIAYEDRELKDVGERLAEQIMGLDNALISFTAASQPVIEHRKRLANTHHQFLRLRPGPPRPATVRLDGVDYPAVTPGAVGRPTTNNQGLIYDIPPGTQGLHPSITQVRIMNPTTTGKYPYPTGYASYLRGNQAAHPGSGRTVSKSDPAWHIPL